MCFRIFIFLFYSLNLFAAETIKDRLDALRDHERARVECVVTYCNEALSHDAKTELHVILNNFKEVLQEYYDFRSHLIMNHDGLRQLFFKKLMERFLFSKKIRHIDEGVLSGFTTLLEEALTDRNSNSAMARAQLGMREAIDDIMSEMKNNYLSYLAIINNYSLNNNGKQVTREQSQGRCGSCKGDFCTEWFEDRLLCLHCAKKACFR